MELSQYIQEKLAERNEDWHEPVVGRYHASKLRKIYYGTIHAGNFFEPPYFNDIALQTMAIGEAYHDFIQKFFKRIEEKHEIDLGEGAKIVMKVDMIDQDDIPHEFKTCSTMPDKPTIEHKTQLMAAMNALKKDYGYITYIKKDPKRFITRTHTVKNDKLYWSNVCDKVLKLHKELTEDNE